MPHTPVRTLLVRGACGEHIFAVCKSFTTPPVYTGLLRATQTRGVHMSPGVLDGLDCTVAFTIAFIQSPLLLLLSYEVCYTR